MKSHFYDLRSRDWTRLLLPPFLAFAGWVVVAQLVLRFDSHRRGTPAATLDAVIIEEKRDQGRSRCNADAVLIGDSSCLMDVSSIEISRACPELRFSNLGTLSTLGLPRFAELLLSFLRTQALARDIKPAASGGGSPSPPEFGPKLVVLLISPEMIRTAHPPITRPPRSEAQERKRRELLAQKSRDRALSELKAGLSMISNLLALPQIRTAFADTLLELPLPGHWGEVYGCFSGFRQYLAAHCGCALDPSDYGEGPSAPPLKSAGLSPAFGSQCEDFRKVLPPGIQLAVGLTPIPQSQSEKGYPVLFRTVVGQLKEALRADAGLANLPPTLPDPYFSTSTHLNELGAREYSHYLCRALREAGLAPARVGGSNPGR